MDISQDPPTQRVDTQKPVSPEPQYEEIDFEAQFEAMKDTNKGRSSCTLETPKQECEANSYDFRTSFSTIFVVWISRKPLY